MARTDGARGVGRVREVVAGAFKHVGSARVQVIFALQCADPMYKFCGVLGVLGMLRIGVAICLARFAFTVLCVCQVWRVVLLCEEEEKAGPQRYFLDRCVGWFVGSLLDRWNDESMDRKSEACVGRNMAEN